MDEWETNLGLVKIGLDTFDLEKRDKTGLQGSALAALGTLKYNYEHVPEIQRQIRIVRQHIDDILCPDPDETNSCAYTVDLLPKVKQSLKDALTQWQVLYDLIEKHEREGRNPH